MSNKSRNRASYDGDVIAWANQQAAFLRSGQFSQLDIEHLADEIEDVGKAEQRELASRMAVLLAHLLKWQYRDNQKARHGASWEKTIKEQRDRLHRRLKKTPSQQHTLADPDFLFDMWADGRTIASKETGIGYERFPDDCPWTMEQVLDNEFWPN